MKTLSLTLLVVLAAGCTDKPDETGSLPLDDVDGDGFTDAQGDCDDADGQVHPGATETWYDGVDQDCDGNDTDQDGDGFEVGDDCDDTRTEVYPDAEELCDELDNDCDGDVDLGVPDGTVVYVDADGDGYGADGTETTACEVTAGWAAQAGDCDDTQPSAYPGAEEVCDDLDNDCDGAINEGDPNEVLYYRDADVDGYGNAADTVLSCRTPDGYVSDATDCDDATADVHPGADEYCDEADRDCDGSPTNDPVDGTPYHLDLDGDTYGDPASEVRSCEVPDGMITDGTDCDDADATVNPAAAEVCDGRDDDCSGAADDGLAFVDYYADADADGYGDAASALSACEEPEGYVLDATDCDDADAVSYPGAAEVCDLEDNDCDGTVDDDALDERAYYEDGDADGYGNAAVTVSACGLPLGYAETDDDCDDADPLVNPGATESCNGLDDDCDDETDEGASDATTYFADADGDGYGNPADTTASCDPVAGRVTDGSDCDDASAANNPAATETCDDADNDCDGTTDEDDAADATTWYVDADGDGYGDAGGTTAACQLPSGYAANADDCDDGNARVSPADAETCDGADDDCDGSIDESGAVGETTWYADADGDTYGDAASPLAACDVPTGYTDDDDDCDDGDAASYPGATEADDLADDDCDGWVDEDFVVSGDVIVSEVTRQPRVGAASTTTNAQWFEVHNTSARDVDLSNWYFSRSNSSVARDGFYVDPDDEVVIAAGGYAVFCKTDDYAAVSTSYSTLVCDYVWGDESASSSYAGTYHDNTFNLQRDQDTLEVYVGGSSTTGTLVDAVTWYYDATNGYWPRDATRSLNLDPAGLDGTSNDAISNWCSTTNSSTYRWYYVSSSNAEYGTPGTANYDCP